MLEKRERVLLDIWAELVLIHENKMRIRLLSEENNQVFAGERYHLVKQGLNNSVPQPQLIVDGGRELTEEGLILV